MASTNPISKVFIHFFLTHFFVLLLPLLITGVISGAYIRGILLEQISMDEQNSLEKYSDQLNNELQKMVEISFKSSNDQDFSPYIVANFTQNARPLMGKLKSYRITNSFINNLYLISHYSDYVYSPSTTYTVQRFIDQRLEHSGIQAPQQLFQLLATAKANSLNENLIQPPKNSAGGSYFVSTLPSSSPRFYGYLVFEISGENLTRLSNSFAQPNGRSLLLLSGNKILAASSDSSPDLMDAVMLQMRLETARVSADRIPAKSGTLELHVDGHSLRAYYSRVGLSDWICVSALPRMDALIRVDHVMRGFVLSLALLLLVGIVATFFVTQLDYLPIRRLARTAGELFHSPGGHGSRNEIRDLIRILDKTRKSLEENTINQSASLIARQYFLMKNLVSGVQYTPRELRDSLEKVGLSLNPDCCFVVIFHPHRLNGGEELLAQINDEINRILPSGVSGFAANLYRENIVGVYSADLSDTKDIHAGFEGMHQALSKQFDILLTVGMGTVRSGTNAISTSFLEAVAALDYRLLLGRNRIISFYDIKLQTGTEIVYPQGDIDELCGVIQNGQRKLVEQILQRLIARIRESADSLYAARLLCYDVINSVIKTLKSMQIRENPELYDPDLISLSNFETMEDLENRLTVFCLKASEHVSTVSALSLSDRTVSYMKAHFTDAGFSLNAVAEALHVSSAHLSRMFKEQKGITMSEYLKLYRVGLAKQLLTETSDSVEKIISLLGYYDASSFIKMFKATEGVTPGEYRKQNLLHAGHS